MIFECEKIVEILYCQWWNQNLVFFKIVKQGEGPNKNDKCYLSAIKANEEAEVIAIKLFIKNAIQQGCASTNIL